MERLRIITQESPWLILVCLLIGALYAFLLYQKASPWSRQINWALAGLRFLVVSIICWLLLLNPAIRQIFNREEKPTIVFALDNSQSIANTNGTEALKKLTAELDQTIQGLKAKDIEVDIQQLDASAIVRKVSDVPLNFPSTNLNSLLNTIQNNYENRNLDKVVLISDGIYNQGVSPAYANYNFPIYALALGDTTPKRDLKIQSVLANKVAYLGNEFPVVAEVENIGYPNRVVTAYLTQNGQLLDKKIINFKGDNDIQQVTFYTTAKQKGIQHYVVSIDVLDGEFTTKNNTRDVYIEVIDGKEKILVVAAAPHPDIKALRSVIEQSENYSFDLHIPGISQLKNEKYDLVIFHQLPSIYRLGNELINQFKDVSRWFIVGAQTDLNEFNRISRQAKVVGRIGRMDQVTPVYNKSFAKFTFEGSKMAMFDKLPPVSVPFGEYSLGNSVEVVLSQKVGNIKTEKPLLIVDQQGAQKTAVMMGEGFWQWRLEEYSLSDSHESFDELITKLIQFLSTKEDKRKLRVYPINAEFYDYEKVIFESEVYNDIYERVYGQKINLSLTHTEGKTYTYSFTSAEGNTRFEISGLPKGVYRYTASADIRGKAEQVAGEFTIKDLQLEALNNTADHNLLRQISEKNDGKFFTINQLNDLKKALLDKRKPNLLHSTEDLSELINLKWLFFLLLALASIEWASRKYLGSY
ncbi:MAG: carboxypeptidase-like regulatory domain-containing protein [Microscillaceae bacterium]|jgi:hypothetical protein|nr:carboxypeptidase-like regulatory domain-containing protein [Microscillaceae bacterium]